MVGRVRTLLLEMVRRYTCSTARVSSSDALETKRSATTPGVLDWPSRDLPWTHGRCCHGSHRYSCAAGGGGGGGGGAGAGAAAAETSTTHGSSSGYRSSSCFLAAAAPRTQGAAPHTCNATGPVLGTRGPHLQPLLFLPRWIFPAGAASKIMVIIRTSIQRRPTLTRPSDSPWSASLLNARARLRLGASAL